MREINQVADALGKNELSIHGKDYIFLGFTVLFALPSYDRFV